MPTTDSDVIQDDVTDGKSASGCDGLIQDEPGTGVYPTRYHQHRRLVRQPSDFQYPRLVAGRARVIKFAEKIGRQCRGAVLSDVGRVMIVMIVFLLAHSIIPWRSLFQSLQTSVESGSILMVLIARRKLMQRSKQTISAQFAVSAIARPRLNAVAGVPPIYGGETSRDGLSGAVRRFLK